MYWNCTNYISFNIYIRVFVLLENSIHISDTSTNLLTPPYLFFFLTMTNFPILLSAPFCLMNRLRSHLSLKTNPLPMLSTTFASIYFLSKLEKSGIFLVNCPLHSIFVSESSGLWFQYLPFHWNYLQLKLHNILNCNVQWKLSILPLAYRLLNLVLLNAPLS